MIPPGERPPDTFESTLAAAHALMRKRDGNRACQLLLNATEHAISVGDPHNAALFSNVRGSYLVSLGRDEEALDAYLEAERISNGEIHYQLSTARHLLVGMEEPERALEKADSLVVLATGPARQAARAIRGIALIALEQPEGAIHEMKAIHAETPAELPALSCDLTLAEVLLRNSLGAEICRRYLRLVESRARQDNEARVLAKVKELQALLPATSSS